MSTCLCYKPLLYIFFSLFCFYCRRKNRAFHKGKRFGYIGIISYHKISIRSISKDIPVFILVRHGAEILYAQIHTVLLCPVQRQHIHTCIGNCCSYSFSKNTVAGAAIDASRTRDIAVQFVKLIIFIISIIATPILMSIFHCTPNSHLCLIDTILDDSRIF